MSPCDHLSSPRVFLVGSMLLIVLVILCFPILYLCVLSFVLWCPLRFPHKNNVRFVLNLQLFVGVLMSYLHYLCLFVYRSVQHILRCVFVFLRLVYLMLSVALDCPFLTSPSVFSNFYLNLTFCSFNGL